MPHAIETTNEVTNADSFAAVLTAGVIDPDLRFNWEAAYVGATWRESRDSGGALIIHPTVCAPDYRGGAIVPVPPHMTAEGWHAFRLDGQRKENARRDRATLEVCALVLMGYVEGRDNYARKLGAALGDFLVSNLVADHSAPGFHEMKLFLMGELDAHPVTAAAAAFAAMRYCQPEKIAVVYGAWHGLPAGRRDRPFRDLGW